MTNSSRNRSADLLESNGAGRAAGKGRPTPRQRPARQPARRPRSRRAVIGGLAVLTVVAASGIALAQRGSHHLSSKPTASQPAPTTSATPAPAQLWRDAALVDLRPLTGLVVNLGQGMSSWRAGTTTARDTAAALDRFEIALVEAQTAIDRRAPLAGASRSVVDLRLTADLYLAAVRVARVATGQPKGAMQDQLVLQFSRLRNLGDRLFDQANAELEPLLGAPREIEGVTVVRAPDVPDWASMKLAPGPPLSTPAAATSPRSYQSSRPTQSLQDWVAAVRHLAIPSGAEEAAALRSGSAGRLADLAATLTAASEAVYRGPDPRGERLVSTRLQLGLLIDAEAARAAQAGTLVTGAARQRLARIGQALAGAGDLVWDPRLGSRTTGFAAS